MAEELKTEEQAQTEQPVLETEADYEKAEEEKLKKAKKKTEKETENTAYDLQEEFSSKPYDLDQLMDFWKKQAGLTKVEPAVEGDALDVTFENGTSIKDKGSSMTMSGKDGKTPDPEDFDKIVKASTARGWRAVAIGPNCSDEFKANLYLACAKNGVDCILNGYNPPEEVKALAKQLYAQAKGKTAETEQTKTAQQNGGSIYNPSEAEVQKQKGETEAEKPAEEKAPKEEAPAHAAGFKKIDNVSMGFASNNTRKYKYDVAALSNKQFAIWQVEHGEIQKKLKENPDKKLTSHEKKIVSNAERFGYGNPDNTGLPKGIKLTARDFDKNFANEFANLKKNRALNKAAIKNLSSSLKLALVDPKNPNYGKLDAEKDVTKETFKQALMHNINTAIVAAKGDEKGNVEARHVVKAVDMLNEQTKKQNKQIEALTNPNAKETAQTKAKTTTKTVAKAPVAKTTVKKPATKKIVKKPVTKQQSAAAKAALDSKLQR